MGISHGVLSVLPCAFAGCVLPLGMEGFQPSAMVAGPQNGLIVADAAGKLLFTDLEDFTLQDMQFSRQESEPNIQGLAMTSPESTYLYLGAEHGSEILEYEWHSSHKIFRTFQLLGLPHDASSDEQHLGLQSLTFVPTSASSQEGYFYASTGISGDVYIYEVPLMSEGKVQSATSVKVWSPLSAAGSTGATLYHVNGLAYADGHLFVCYDMEDSARILIFDLLQSGLPAGLREQHQLDVQRPADLAARKATEDEWQIFLISKETRHVYGYAFRFLEGFQLHPYCTEPETKDVASGPKMALVVATFWCLRYL